MRIAIVGSGIAGLAAAHALAGTHDVVMYEAAARPGGHVYTVDADGHAIDMGFIVCNRERYPQFCGLLDELGIATRPTTMSFSVVHGDLEWGSESLDAMFAQRRRLVDPRHWRFLARVVAFLLRGRRDLHGQLDRAREPLDRGPSVDDYLREPLDRSLEPLDRGPSLDDYFRKPLDRGPSLDDYMRARRIPDDIRERFVVPLAAALWSLAPDRCGAFPALTFLRFLDQHGMLSPIRPLSWHTVVGGSCRYVDALLANLHARGRFALRLSTAVTRIERDPTGRRTAASVRACDQAAEHRGRVRGRARDEPREEHARRDAQAPRGPAVLPL